MADEPIEEGQERKFDGEDAEPEEASDSINFRIGTGKDIGKLGSDWINTSSSKRLHENTVKARIEQPSASYRGCNGDKEEAIVHIEASEAAIADDCPTNSNRRRY